MASRAQYVFENIDRARTQGLALEGRATLPAGWLLSGNYTHIAAIDGNGAPLEKRHVPDSSKPPVTRLTLPVGA